MDSSLRPQVSLVVPVYNAAEYLQAGVEALLAQSFPSMEILLVDDGSTDGSAVLCDRLAAQDERVRVIHQANAGAGPARNAGIDAAQGEYIMFPDADDVCLPDMVERLVQAAEKSRAEVVICGYHSFDEAGERETVLPPQQGLLEGQDAVRRFAARLFPLGLVGYPWNKLYRLSLIRDHQLRFPPMRRFQDGVFNLSVFDCATRVELLAVPLYRYKINNLQGIFQKFPANIFDLLKQITDAFYEKREAWGLNGPEYERHIRPYFLNGVVGCVDCLYSPAWHMTPDTRREYLQKLAEDDTFRRCAGGGSAQGLSRYAVLVVRLLYKKSYRRVLVAARIKLFLKARCRSLFYRLKGA